MPRSGDTVDTPLDEAVLTDSFSAVAVSTDAASAPNAPAPQDLFAEGKLNEGGNGVAFALPSQDGETTLFSILCVDTSEDVQSLCGGFIGGDTSRFCIKPSSASGHKNCCTTLKHRSDKFTIKPQCCYIVKNSFSAFTSPEGDISMLNPKQVSTLREERRPMLQWHQIFTIQSNARVKSELKNDEETSRKMKLLDKTKALQTPVKRKISQQLKQESDEEETFFDTDTVVKFDIPDDQTWSSLPNSFQTFFSTLVHGVSEQSAQSFGIARDVRALEKGLDDVGVDLGTLDVRLQSVQGQVGETIRIGNLEFPNVSAGLGELEEKISPNERTLNSLSESLGTSLEEVEKNQKSFETIQTNRWLALGPLVR